MFIDKIILFLHDLGFPSVPGYLSWSNIMIHYQSRDRTIANKSQVFSMLGYSLYSPVSTDVPFLTFAMSFAMTFAMLFSASQ